MKKVCIFCAETVKICAAASEYICYVPANVWLLLGVFQCFLKNLLLLLKDIHERLLLKRKCAAASGYIFFMLKSAFRNISMFFNEHVAASEKLFHDCF